MICEFSHVGGILGPLYRFYLKNLLPKISKLMSKNPAAYDYLSESIMAWPKQRELKEDIEDAGFSKSSWKNLTFGVVALHEGTKPN